MNCAPENAKRDHEATLDELEAVNQRFDEATREAEKRGKDSASVDVRDQMQHERDEEIEDLKKHLAKLASENAELQSKVDDAEMSLAVAKDSQVRNVEGVEVQSELVKQLQGQLKRSKEELSKKESEMGVIVLKWKKESPKPKKESPNSKKSCRSLKESSQKRRQILLCREEKKNLPNRRISRKVWPNLRRNEASPLYHPPEPPSTTPSLTMLITGPKSRVAAALGRTRRTHTNGWSCAWAMSRTN